MRHKSVRAFQGGIFAHMMQKVDKNKREGTVSMEPHYTLRLAVFRLPGRGLCQKRNLIKIFRSLLLHSGTVRICGQCSQQWGDKEDGRGDEWIHVCGLTGQTCNDFLKINAFTFDGPAVTPSRAPSYLLVYSMCTPVGANMEVRNSPRDCKINLRINRMCKQKKKLYEKNVYVYISCTFL